MEEILTPEQVSQLLQVHPFTVLKFIRQGKLKASKLGRMYRVRRVDVEKFLDNQANAVVEPKMKAKKGKEQVANEVEKKTPVTEQDTQEFSSDSVLTPESKEVPSRIDKEFQPPKDETDHYVIELNY